MKKILTGKCVRGGLALTGIIACLVITLLKGFDTSMAIATIICGIGGANSYQKSKLNQTFSDSEYENVKKP